LISYLYAALKRRSSTLLWAAGAKLLRSTRFQIAQGISIQIVEDFDDPRLEGFKDLRFLAF
jgi:hypothetical protein